jgi:hypothetical protein
VVALFVAGAEVFLPELDGLRSSVGDTGRVLDVAFGLRINIGGGPTALSAVVHELLGCECHRDQPNSEDDDLAEHSEVELLRSLVLNIGNGALLILYLYSFQDEGG